MNYIEVSRKRKIKTLEPDVDARASSLANNWNRDPSWLWPPPLNQAYCKLHFLKECSLYHLLENECFKLKVETQVPKAKKTSKWPTAPTRVQPARRAREKNSKDQAGTSTSRQSSPARNSKTNEASNTLDISREKLLLHLSWPIYKTQLESHIKQVFDRLYGSKHESAGTTNLHHHSGINLRPQCRYCRFDPVVVDCEGAAPRRLNPPAPMYCIALDGIKEEQIGEFGGIKFAVGLSAGHEAIILLGMEKLDD
ncbi:uncharacterized protein F4812DRAFT_425419 [Daldinia caldariorum]|uniref:uncharacterized protein n=1 Tax=Daldinia caldariorum TaxID=326644 RepID=UPI00200800BD|nr:uncharacterized protein F4812DRAFT_425419 [Daldinia caldariorum]KAI1469003.1 hypothetical protein F4812DRAFT_425419 [Daldinia caldariorum]